MCRSNASWPSSIHTSFQEGQFHYIQKIVNIVNKIETAIIELPDGGASSHFCNVMKPVYVCVDVREKKV